MVEIFIKSVKDTDEVFEICDNHRRNFYPELKMNDYLAYRYITMALDEKDPIKQIQKECGRYKHILKKALTERLNPKKIKVNWTPITRELDLSPPDYDLMKYIHDYSPTGFRNLSMLGVS